MSDAGDNNLSDSSSDMGQVRNDSDSASDHGSDPQQSESALGSESSPSSSSDDVADNANRLLDLEASESSDDARGGYDLDRGSESSFGSNDLLDGTEVVDFWTGYKFPQFTRLPPELRHRVWQLFCPMLEAPVRVIRLILRGKHSSLSLSPDPMLSKQAELLATLLRINQESRSIVTKALPDTLSLYNDGYSHVRFNPEKDVVFIKDWYALDKYCPPPSSEQKPEESYRISGFSDKVKYLALDGFPLDEEILEPFVYESMMTLALNFLMGFDDLRAVFYMQNSRKTLMRSMHWCGQPELANVYNVSHTEENEFGIEKKISHTLVWPKIDKFRYPDSRGNMPDVHDLSAWGDVFVDETSRLTQPGTSADSTDHIEPPLLPSEALAGIELWPMMQFRGLSGECRLEKLRKSEIEELEGYDYDYDDDDESEIGYEYSDVEGESFEDRDSDMSDFVEWDSGDTEAEVVEGDEFQHQSLAGPNTAHSQGDSPRLDSSDHESSDEEDSDSHGSDNGSSRSESERDLQSGHATEPNSDVSLDSDEPDEIVRRPKRKARHVVDSDDEDGTLDNQSDDARPAKMPRRARYLVASSDSENDNQDHESKDVESELESEEEGEGQEGGGSLSFVERLRLHRDANPVGSDAESASDTSQSRGSSIARFAQDVSDDDGDDGENDSEGGLGNYEDELDEEEDEEDDASEID